jgi:hypothetical protein
MRASRWDSIARFGAEKSSPAGPNNSTTTVGENMQFKIAVGKAVRSLSLFVLPSHATFWCFSLGRMATEDVHHLFVSLNPLLFSASCYLGLIGSGRGDQGGDRRGQGPVQGQEDCLPTVQGRPLHLQVPVQGDARGHRNERFVSPPSSSFPSLQLLSRVLSESGSGC